MAAVPKYRLSLSLAQLKWIAAQARQAPESALTVELYRNTLIQITKIEADAVKAAFVVTTPAAKVSEASPVQYSESDEDVYLRLTGIPTEQRTEEDKRTIRQYRYFNNLMAPDEEAEYEQTVGNTDSDQAT